MKTTISTKEIKYSLQNSDNFNKELDCELGDAVEKLSQLFIDYFKFISENIKLKNSKYIVMRGLDTIVNVFNHILLYTKNLDATYFHCQKAFYLYVEFVGQISDEEKIFLQLSSKDATSYVYKKTIYEIDNEIRKSTKEISDYTKIKLDIINSYIELYKILLFHLINNDFNNVEYVIRLSELYKKFNKLNDKTLISKINAICYKLYYSLNDVGKFYNILDLILKKIAKTPEFLNKSTDKFLSEEFMDKLNETPDKFVSWFIA